MANTKRCKKCIFWSRSDLTEKEHVGKCHNGHIVDTSGGNTINSNELGASDCENYRVHFTIGADFGCVHWSKRCAPKIEMSALARRVTKTRLLVQDGTRIAVEEPYAAAVQSTVNMLGAIRILCDIKEEQ